jgi:hypothetical protein
VVIKNFYFILLISFLTSCASKKPLTPQEFENTLNHPNASVPVGEAAPPTDGYTLVLGGVGISSFATIGVLKAFSESKIKINKVITTGWPTLFVLAEGFLGSYHDLEWFSMRLDVEDFLDSVKKFSDNYPSKKSIYISVCNLENAEPEVFSKGNWKEALKQTFSFPGIYRPYSKTTTYKVKGLDVEEAIRQGDKKIIAVSMYGDFFSDPKAQNVYWSILKKETSADFARAEYRLDIKTLLTPLDYNPKARRQSIRLGYQITKQFIKNSALK